jgi:ParB family chromosome partitioning protein
MARNTKPRLGRGLSSLMSEPVPVTPADDAQAVQDLAGSASEIEAKPANPSTGPQAEVRAPDAGATIRHLQLDSIHPNKYQPRSTVNEEDLAGLAASIRETGLMQPIAVRAVVSGQTSGGGSERFELIAGERRWRAARLAGLSRIPAIVHDVDDRRSAEWAIIENVQREDLNPIDRGTAYANLSRNFGLTQSEIAERVGVDRSTIANLIRIVELEPEIRDLIAAGRLSTGHAKALLSMPGGPKRVEVAHTAAERSQTVRALEAICASQHEAGHPTVVPSTKDQKGEQIAAAIDDLAKGIGEHLGTRVRIRTRDGQKGALEIEFYDLDHFDGLMQRIGYAAGA